MGTVVHIAAWACHSEDEIRSLEFGKFADITEPRRGEGISRAAKPADITEPRRGEGISRAAKPADITEPRGGEGNPAPATKKPESPAMCRVFSCPPIDITQCLLS